jgi:hypothetical protein
MFCAESVDVHDKALNTHDVVWNGFRAVPNCHGDAVGVAPAGEFRPMTLSFFGTPCDYGLTVIPRVALLLAACDRKPGFPMGDWASKRRAQIDGRTA